MNRGRLLIIAGIIAFFGVAYGIYTFTRGTEVVIKGVDGVDGVVLRSEQDGNETTINVGESARVAREKYVYRATGQNLATIEKSIEITGREPVTISIDYAPFSEQHLASLTKAAERELSTLTSARYLRNVPSFTIHTIRLYDRGQIAAAIVVPDYFDSNNPSEVYRIIYTKSSSSKWAPLGKPELLRTTTNSPGLPVEVLKQINDIASS